MRATLALVLTCFGVQALSGCGAASFREPVPYDQVQFSIETRRTLRVRPNAVIAIVRARRALVRAEPGGNQVLEAEVEVLEPIRNAERGARLSFQHHSPGGPRLLDPNRTYVLALFSAPPSPEGLDAIPIRPQDVDHAAARIRVQLGD